MRSPHATQAQQFGAHVGTGCRGCLVRRRRLFDGHDATVDEPAPTVASEKAQPIPMPSPTVDAKAKKLVKDLPVPPITFKKSINLTISNHSSWPVAASIAWLGFFKEEHNTKLLQPRQDMNSSSVALPNVSATMIWAAIATDHTKANTDLSNVIFVNSYKGEPFSLGHLTVDGVRQPNWNHKWPQAGQRVYVYSGVGYLVEREADVGDHKIFVITVIDAPRIPPTQ